MRNSAPDATVMFDGPKPLNDATVNFDRPVVRDDATVLIDRIRPDGLDGPEASSIRRLGVVRTVLLATPAGITATALGVVGAADRQMWNDEYATWHASTLGIDDFVRLLQKVDTVHALYYVFMHAWIAAFGDSPLALRGPSIAATAITAGVLTLLGRRLFSAPVGLTAGLLFAIIPSVSRYAQEARSYAAVTAVAVVATVLLLRALECPRWGRWFLYGVTVAALAWLNFVALLVLAPHGLLFWRAAHRAQNLRVWRGLAAVTVLVVAALPLLSRASQQSGQISWIKAKPLLDLPQSLFASQTIAVIVLAAAAVGALVLHWAHRFNLAVLLAWTVLPPAFCYATFDMLHLLLARYLLFTLPAWALLAAVTVNALVIALPARRTTTVASVIIGITAVATVAYIGLPDQREVRRSPVVGQPDYRGAILAIRDQAQPGDGIAYNDVFGELSGLGRKATRYELRHDDAPRDVFLEVSAAVRGSFSGRECDDWSACLGDTQRLWLVSTTTSRDPFDGLSDPRKALLRGQFTASAPQQFQGVRVVLLTRAGSVRVPNSK
ncbi:glycosyltransferase family 39 protein [Micromonospora soli]|uniref:glycosyltransferase family 39 protein n=1 Tax=Micromonospora sp. NBRC 110009 TaxID=3061627 RepID=UPI0026737517|nr:glycosyltransferase family 39 protein [Micromonospora sp. NBRC 110009]WKT96971.1 glycosyltransferase family 39 protein [Micromonospora sp. NBRC 110009]